MNAVPQAAIVFLGGDGSDGDWGGYVILAMVLSPCIVGGLWRLADRIRERRGRGEASG
jgi:hypothetical protein